MKGNSTLRNAILKELASPRTNYDILNDIDIPEFEIQQLDIDPTPQLTAIPKSNT